MTCPFSLDQIASLSAPFDRVTVGQRRQGRSQLSYLEGWPVIAEANRIFGFDGWQRETVALRCVHQVERSIASASGAATPGSRRSWCRSDRCAQQSSTKDSQCT
jgi:Recombination DNA repair protein (RAD52 pathway)